MVDADIIYFQDQDRDLIKDECRCCGIDINENEIESYGHQCRQCFRNNFESEEN